MTPKQIHEVEQATAFITEHLPSLWRQIYDNCIKEGFTEKQSMELLKTYILKDKVV